MNVALAEVRSRRLTGAFARDWRVPGWEGWKSVQSGLFPVPTLYEHIIKHRLCLSSKLKKKQSFKAIPGHESASEKYRKQRFLHDRTAGMPRTSCPDRNNTIGLLVTGPLRINIFGCGKRAKLTFFLFSRRNKVTTAPPTHGVYTAYKYIKN